MPAWASTSSSIRNWPLSSAAGRVSTCQAASAMISGLRQLSGLTPGIIASAAVWITVRGHSALTAIPYVLSSGAMPSTAKLMPILARV